jgi:hypothetical protein
VNADLFFLLALQQACSEGIVRWHYPSCGAVWCLYTLVRLSQAVGWPSRWVRRSDPCPAERWDPPGTAANGSA